MPEEKSGNSDNGNRKLTVALPDDLYARLSIAATQRRIDRADNASMSALICEAVESYLSKLDRTDKSA